MKKIKDLFVEEITLVAPKGAEKIEDFILKHLGTIMEIKHQAYRVVLYPDMEYLAKRGSVYTFSDGKLNVFI